MWRLARLGFLRDASRATYLRTHHRVRAEHAPRAELDVAEQVHARAEAAPGADHRARGDDAERAHRGFRRQARARVDRRGGVYARARRG